jgi:serine/threonine protein kinase/tetratricopeptide (TPR) repeat protein
MKSASERDDVHLAEVLEQYLEALNAGTASPRAEFLACHPELAEQLEACLASLDFIRRAGNTPSPDLSSVAEEREKQGGGGQVPFVVPPSGGTAVPDATDAPPTEDFAASRLTEPLQLGSYRILREIGRGGMGIVYEAEERSDGEHVALKVLPFAAALDPRQLQRFKNEAEAAALLHHPHIVPVLAVGSEEDVHYYAMKYIHGRTLAKEIADRRLKIADFPGVAETPQAQGLGGFENAGPKSAIYNVQSAIFIAQLGVQAAEALEQAHQVGIIHRDIKPANLLVEPNGHLWVTDFGLALFQHDAAGLTLTGDLVGTLRYMSPEQALGKRGIVDQRTDIYSLGVTLYEMATLRPAFSGDNRQELLRKLAYEEPCPPGRLNKTIPRAFETILLKATAKEPAARYTTAQEFANDLGRFVAGQPIVARRPSFLDRVQRWTRRHRGLVNTLAAIALTGMAISIVFSIFMVRERDEADRWAEEARRAADDMYTQVAQKWWFQQPYMEQVQREFLLKALVFYEKFSRERGNSARLRLETAKAARRVGDIQHKLDERARAAEAYRGAISKLTQLAAEFPDETVYRRELADAHNHHGHLLRDEGKLAEAEKAYRLAHELFGALAAEDSKQPDYREGMGGSLFNLGIVLSSQRRTPEAEKAYRQALSVLTPLTKDHPDIPSYQLALAGGRNDLAMLLRDTNRPGEAQLLYEQALADWRTLAAQLPGMPIFRAGLAASHNGLGIIYAAAGRRHDAEIAYRSALALRERLAQEHPGVPVYRQALASSQHSLGRLLGEAGYVKQARAFYDRALALRKNLAKERQGVNLYRQELADTYQALAGLLSDSGQPRGAEGAAREALALRQQLVRRERSTGIEREVSSSTAAAFWDLVRCQRQLASILREAGQLEDAEALCREAIGRTEKLATEFPTASDCLLELAATRGDLAVLCQRVDRLAESEKLYRATLDSRAQLATQFHDVPYYRAELGAGQVHLGNLLQDTGRPGKAEAAYRQAIAIAQKLAADFPAVSDYQRLLVVAKQQLGELLLAVGKLPEAEQTLRQARPLLDKLAAEFPALPPYRELTARHQHTLGVFLTRTNRPVDAEQAFRQELILRDKLATEFAEDAGLTRDLAHLLANCPDSKLRQPQRAVELATKAAAANSKDAATLSVLGLAHYRAGELKAAVAVLEKAEKRPGKYRGGPFILAMAYWQLGDRQKGMEVYRQGSAWMEQYHPCDEELRGLAAEATAMLSP